MLDHPVVVVGGVITVRVGWIGRGGWESSLLSSVHVGPSCGGGGESSVSLLDHRGGQIIPVFVHVGSSCMRYIIAVLVR